MRKTKSMIHAILIIAVTLISIAIASGDSFAIGVRPHPLKPMKPLGHTHGSLKGTDHVDMVPSTSFKEKRGPINLDGGHDHPHHVHPPHFPQHEKCKDSPGINNMCKK